MKRRAKKVQGFNGRFRHENNIPPGSIVCPQCGTEMNSKFDAFTCYSSVAGPYLKVSIFLECAAHECRYRQSINAHSQDAGVLNAFEYLVTDISRNAVIEPSWNRIVRRAGTILRRARRNSIALKLRTKGGQ